MSAVRRIGHGFEMTVTVAVALLCVYLGLTAMPGFLGAMGIGPYQDPYFLAESMARAFLGILLFVGLLAFGKVADFVFGRED